jgi:hypothetical protein
MALDDYRAQYDREVRDYNAAVDALTPAQREAWGAIVALNEAFDGEWGIAHGILARHLRERTLIRAGRAARSTLRSWGA